MTHQDGYIPCPSLEAYVLPATTRTIQEEDLEPRTYTLCVRTLAKPTNQLQ